MKLLFDIEADGLLDTITKVHVIAIKDMDTGESTAYSGDRIATGIELLQSASVLVGHNIINYDVPALSKIYPAFSPKGKLVDTLVLSRAIYSDLFGHDMAVFKRKLSPRDYGSHSLRAWGNRLNTKKGLFSETADWSEWSQEMEDYCLQDVEVTGQLYAHLMRTNPPQLMIDMELAFARLMDMQEAYGFLFDKSAAEMLQRRLGDRFTELESELQELVPPTIKELKTKVKVIPFNPGSQQQIANYFTNQYGWTPTEFTKTGKPRITEEVLKELPYPEADKMAELFKLRKVLGMLADGPTAWLKLVAADSRIHGHVNTGGTATGRCSHSNPNLAQVPSARTELGAECRKLFVAPAGYKIVGVDAAALESRCLAHFLHQFDGGEFKEELLTGDIHSKNAQAFGCDRNTAKTAFYALMYGCGGKKLATILGRDEDEGREIIDHYYNVWPQIKQLNELTQQVAKSRGHLYGLDKRHLPYRNLHSTLNVVLQSAGALVMKMAAVLLKDTLDKAGLHFGVDYAFVANIHDEMQLEVKDEHATFVGEQARLAIIKAGERFKFKCPLDGEYKIGTSWYETH